MQSMYGFNDRGMGKRKGFMDQLVPHFTFAQLWPNGKLLPIKKQKMGMEYGHILTHNIRYYIILYIGTWCSNVMFENDNMEKKVLFRKKFWWPFSPDLCQIDL